MHEEMIAYVREHGGAASVSLAQEFFKFKNPDGKIAHAAVFGILSKDRRCYFGDDNLWHATALAAQAPTTIKLSDVPWAAVYLMVLPENPKKAAHVSVWFIQQTPELLFEQWLVNPDTLPFEEREILTSVRDTPFEHDSLTRKTELFAQSYEKRTPVFLSFSQQMLSAQLVQDAGLSFPDNGVLISTLFGCAGMPLPRPLTLAACHNALFGKAPALSYAYKQGECFAKCLQELFDILNAKGITDFSDLEAAEQLELKRADFSGKGFSYDDIIRLPAAPGVYGFKNRDNAYIYIGKGSNLRRRLMSYFRRTDESPEKLEQLRSEAQHLVTYQCGSELECLIYEYRLIQKHSPLLNTQMTINERKGAFLPLDDCIVLLPNAGQGKGMSFWFRKNQKIMLRPFNSDFSDGPAIETELQKFFFSGTLPPSPDDFPEQEIATRWVKQRKDELCIVLVNRSESGREAYGMMRSFWKDILEKQAGMEMMVQA
jgi:hypothetical protein